MSVIRHTLIDGKHVECAYDGKFDHECGVCVVGAGTAGAVAAISAARRGMDVLTVDLAPIPGEPARRRASGTITTARTAGFTRK